MARFEIYCGSTLIGHSELEAGDAPMGVAGGRFLPLPSYRQLQPRVVALRETSQQELALSVCMAGGGFLPAQGGVQIFDYSADLGAEGLEVHVNGIPYPLYGEMFPNLVAAYERQFKSEG
ncbi:MAG: hypothetical protein AB1899_10270 [Pseudomonadota bacterium]